ncbi:MAG: hypothetical protein ACP5D7_17980 [Limnospira sp.]
MLNPEGLGILIGVAIARFGLGTGIDRPGRWQLPRRQSVPECIVWVRSRYLVPKCRVGGNQFSFYNCNVLTALAVATIRL